MLQQETPADYVLGTGETHSVRDFCQAAFECLGLDYERYVVQDARFYRPAEVDLLVADPTKARQNLKWKPDVQFQQLVKMMIEADIENVAREIS
jgi:GDPmannose 4,6-dehydratase